MDNVVCPLCGKQVEIVTYGGGRIAACCKKLIYNGKPLNHKWESFDGLRQELPAESREPGE